MDTNQNNPAQPPQIVDVDSNSFDQFVIEQSFSRLVLVDFWAPWCGPCRSLAPILHKIIDDSGGSIALVKVNTDDQRELATRYNILSLPTVMLFRDGVSVDQFMGVQSEPTIRQMLERYVVRQSDIQLKEACDVYDAGDTDVGFRMVLDAIADDPNNDRLKLKAVEWFLDHRKYADAGDMLKSLSKSGKNDPKYKSHAARLALAQQTNTDDDLERLATQVATHDQDLEARYQLGLWLALREQFKEALDQFIEIIKRDRRFRDDAPRQNALLIFDILGEKNELVSRYRGLLARILN